MFETRKLEDEMIWSPTCLQLELLSIGAVGRLTLRLRASNNQFIQEVAFTYATLYVFGTHLSLELNISPR